MRPTSEIPASERGITAPDQVANPGRRAILRRASETVVAAGAAAVTHNLWLPHTALGAQKPTESGLVLPMTAEQAARNGLAEMRSIKRDLVPTTAEPITIPGRKSFGPGDRVDRGNPDEEVFYLRGDDFWLQDAGHAYLDIIEGERIPVVLAPVEEAVIAFPDLIKRADSLKDSRGRKLVQWANHTRGHKALDQKTTPDIMRVLLPQTHALENVLLREERSLFIAPPYGAGAMPGYEDTDPQIEASSKRLQSAILGWTIDTRSWDGATENQIVDTVLSKIVKGAIIITHPVPSGDETRALQRWVRTLRNRGWRAGRLSELPHPKATGH